jgi:hypothetical protein
VAPAAFTQDSSLQRTEHLEVAYPEGAESELGEFLDYAELVYAEVDSLMGGAVASPIRVTLVREGTSGSTPEGITLSLHMGPQVRELFARELARAAARKIVGPTYEAGGYRFLDEGLAAWVEARYERARGAEEPRWLRAAFAYMEEATYLEYLETFTQASEEVGREVVSAAGYSFVSHLVDRYGWQGVLTLLAAMKGNIDVCSSLDDAGYDCEEFLDSWDAALAAEAAKHDFTLVPDVWADLLVAGEGDYRDVSLLVYIRNPEATSYLYFISYVIGEEPFEESFAAASSDFEAVIPLGQVPVGTRVLWEVAVWSRTVRTWKKSGWQDRTAR